MYAVLLFVMVVGWFANIVQLILQASDPATVLFVLKTMSMFVFPLGSIFGIIGMF